MNIPITQDFVPAGRRNRPVTYPQSAAYQKYMTPKFITIHNTGNPRPGASAKMHANWIKTGKDPTNPALDLLASWHFTVDDREIIQHLPLNENGWHAADGINGVGNRQSIGIEICEWAYEDYMRGEINAAWLTAKLLKEFNLPITAVKQHYDWSGKNCPSVIRKRKGGWEGFISEVNSFLLNDDIPVIPGPEVLTGTPIIGPPQATIAQAQAWAKSRGAHQRFIDIAPLYWQYGKATGIRPEVMYAQSAHETGYGKYTGVLTPDFNNWAGLKTRAGGGCSDPEAHERFLTPADGVRAHFNHMSAYVGLEPIGEPHGRYYVVKGLAWAGTVKTVEELGGKWAPRAGYGQSIVGLINALLATKAPVEEKPVEEPKPPAEKPTPEPTPPDNHDLMNRLMAALKVLYEILRQLFGGN